MSAQRKAVRLAGQKDAIRRREFLTGSAGLAAYAALPAWARPRHGLAVPVSSGGGGGPPGGVFNFFIAPGGDDNNNGLTPATAWSLTALNTKQSTYRTQAVGIVGDVSGTQTPLQYGQVGGVQTSIYSLLQGVTGGSNTPVLSVDGGTSGSPTYIGSCNSSGAYVRGWAIIDCSNPSGGAHPTTDGAQLMGQCGDSGTQVPHPDNVTFDGLVIRNFSFSAITGQSASTILTNCVYKNLEFSGSNNASTSNNPGCIRLDRNSAQILNCKFHDCAATTGGFPPAYPGMMIYTSQGVVVTNCTFYNMAGGSIQQKDSNQDATISYCYLDCGSFGVPAGAQFYGSYFEGITGAGRTTTIHHCILLGPIYLSGGSPVNYSGNYNVYNNTFYPTGSEMPIFYLQAPNAGGTFNAYNNVFYEQGGSWTVGSYGVGKLTGATSTTIPTWDYNYYLTGPQFCPSGNGGTLVSYASWQGLGFDTHSHVGGNPFSGTPAAITPSSFAINSSSAAFTGSNTGGICGALDGSGSIGCNF